MAPYIKDIEEARRIIADVREIADPLARGDLPTDFSLEEIEEAHADAAQVLAYMTQQLRNIPDAIDHRDADVFSDANSYFRTLTHVLLRSEEVSDHAKKLLQLCAVAPPFIAEQIIRLPAYT